MKKNREHIRCLSRILAVLMTVVLMACVAVPVAAANENTAVREASTGVLQVNLLYRDDNNSNQVVGFGSSFLINSNTIVTCAHCVNLTDTQLQFLAETFGKSVAEVKDRLSYSVTVSRDITITARITQMSVEMDYAIMTLETSLQDRSPMTIRPSSTVAQTESVYAIGFPEESSLMQNINKYTSDDVTITTGVVNKVATGKNLYSGANTDYIQTSCKLSDGNSGGPMVDEDGYVIGICEGYTGTEETGDDYFYGVAIDQVTLVLNALGIQWTQAPGYGEQPAPTEPNPTGGDTVPTAPPAPALDTGKLESLMAEAQLYQPGDYSEESYSALTAALDNAASVKSSATSQTEIDEAVSTLNTAILSLEKAGGMSMGTILLIAAAVAVVIVVVVVIIVVSSGKKSAADRPNGSTPDDQTWKGTDSAKSGGFVPSTMQETVSTHGSGTRTVNPESGETTLLNQGSGETTLLRSSVRGGTLVRKRNGQSIEVTSAEYTIGRERKRVDYCISDNTSVSRVHAKLIVENGTTYLMDMNAANGTTVNHSKLRPGEKVALKDGDVICLADEEFEFRA